MGACQLGGASRRGGGNSDGVGLNHLVGGEGRMEPSCKIWESAGC